jgi:signal transduction histidine kinase
MTEEQIKNAFEPFYTTKDPGKGTGLGLWICYQIICNHQGTISVETHNGTGTTVQIELPCDVEDADAGAIEVQALLTA